MDSNWYSYPVIEKLLPLSYAILDCSDMLLVQISTMIASFSIFKMLFSLYFHKITHLNYRNWFGLQCSILN